MDTQRRAFLVGASSVVFGHPVAAKAAPTAIAQSMALTKTGDAPLPREGASRFIQVNNIRLHYVVAGSGPAVILLHGWPQTWFAWRATMDRLSPHFTVIAPDLRGVGLSERTPAGYDKRTIAADIRGREAGPMLSGTIWAAKPLTSWQIFTPKA